MVFTAHGFDACRGRYACFSARWSDQRIFRELLTSVLRGPPKIARTELGCEPYMLGKLLRSSFQQFLRFANPSSVEGDMLTLVSIGQKFRDSRQLFFFVSCRKGKAIPQTAFDTLKLLELFSLRIWSRSGLLLRVPLMTHPLALSVAVHWGVSSVGSTLEFLLQSVHEGSSKLSSAPPPSSANC